MKAKYLMIATVAILLTACSNDENEVNNGPVEARITARMGAETRAVNSETSTFEENDAIGVMVTKVEQTGGSGATSNMVTRYKNVKYTTSRGTQSGSSAAFEAAATGAGIFFQDATETVTFAAYYPYQQSNADALPGTNGAISVNTQNNNTKSDSDNKQAKIDFLFALGATASKNTPTVIFKDNCQFQHKMAQLKLVVKASTDNGFTAEEAKVVCNGTSTYKLGGLIHEGTFTLNVAGGTATGVAITTGGSVSDWNITDCVHTDDGSKTTRTYTLILLPQNVSGSALTFEANIGGQTYKNTDAINPNLQAGNTYTYTITVKKTGLTVSGCNIEAWGTGSTGSGDATM